MSRGELAALAGVTTRMVGKVERGETEALIPAWQMAQAMSCPFAEMIAEAERAAS